MLSSFTVYLGIWEAGQLNADNFRNPQNSSKRRESQKHN